MLDNHPLIKYPEDTPPQLIVIIDTEEEFDWSAEPDLKANSITAISQIYRVQEIFNEYGIKPCYVVDYPVASQQESIDILKDFYDNGQCDIGAHLHPWVNPPHSEVLSRSNMFPGNLNYDQEYNKLKVLTQKIMESFGHTPTIYRAGRFGVGKNTTRILEELGYSIDVSVCCPFDFSLDGGPDFSDFRAEPYWFGKGDSLLEIPLSGAFVGFSGRLSKYIYNSARYLNYFKSHSILSRLSITDRLLLSPEGHTTEEHKKLTQFLFNQGIRIFSWNFHSTSVAPSMTMYTKSEKDVEQFLDSFRRYFDFFFDELGGIATTPTQIKEDLNL